MRGKAVAFLLLACFSCGLRAESRVPLLVASGVPLRLYLTKRLSKRLGQPVQAKVLEPVYAFDREVIPAGTEVRGSVVRLDRVSKMRRATAVVNGDFTPLHEAQVQFTTLLLPDGRTLTLETAPTAGLTSLYSPPKQGKKTAKKASSAAPSGGILGTGKAQIKEQINSRTRGVVELVRGPDKKERLQEFLMDKLPYHPQWVRKGTRFDAELRQPLSFGETVLADGSLPLLGTQPPADSVVHARLVTALDSGTAQQSQPVEAILTQPLFSADHRLILPQGTRVAGAVTFAHRARWFHRTGQLRFSFQTVNLPPGLEAAGRFGEGHAAQNTPGVLDGAESSGKAAVKVDEEGGVKATEPKTRLIGPAIAAMTAARSMDNDRSRRTGERENNSGARTLAGGSGFGLLGMLAAQSSHPLSSALGYYGLGWSVYNNLIARGPEVEFSHNAVVDIRFGGRPPVAAQGKQLRASVPTHPAR